jgi:hypothetical protein
MCIRFAPQPTFRSAPIFSTDLTSSFEVDELLKFNISESAQVKKSD